MSIIEQIRAEIERLKGQLIRGACAAQIEMETNCKDEAYNDLLSFLGTLESEKPMNQDELEEEIEMEWDSFNKHLAEYDDDDSDEVIWLNKFSFTDLARHFAQWQKEQMMKEAVEGEVEYNYDEKGRAYYSIRPTWITGNIGDKVRIIIVKD